MSLPANEAVCTEIANHATVWEVAQATGVRVIVGLHGEAAHAGDTTASQHGLRFHGLQLEHVHFRIQVGEVLLQLLVFLAHFHLHIEEKEQSTMSGMPTIYFQ